MLQYCPSETAPSGLGHVPNWAFCPLSELFGFGDFFENQFNFDYSMAVYGSFCDATCENRAQKLLPSKTESTRKFIVRYARLHALLKRAPYPIASKRAASSFAARLLT